MKAKKGYRINDLCNNGNKNERIFCSYRRKWQQKI